MKIFAQGELREFLSKRLESLTKEVHSEERNKLLNINETEYVKYLVEKHKIDPLCFDFENISISDREDLIRAERFPHNYFVRPGKSYPKHVITYHIPFSGNQTLLQLSPSTRLLWTIDVNVVNENVCFDIINWDNDPESLKRQAAHILSSVQKQVDYLYQEIKAFNARLESVISTIVLDRKAEYLKQANLLARLGVPIKKSGQVPSTFAVPIAKKPAIIKPSAPNTPYNPEPALDLQTYSDILKICRDAGVEMERHPGIYSGKEEEDLRDYFLMVLAPHFQSTTGETFNKSGKTDILIRHEKANVFVAECKFWKGGKAFADTIDQILGYLTWRDSKAAILFFIRNKEISPVLNQIEGKAAEHSCFIKSFGRKAEGWYEFEFHLKDDATRGVKLAVLCFHFSA